MIQIREITNKAEWEEFQNLTPRSNILQAWNWGVFQKSLGREVFNLGVYNDNSLIATCQCYIIPTKLRTHLYTSNGPVYKDWSLAKESFPILLQKLKEIAQKNNAVFVRIDPVILDIPENHKLFASFGLTRASMHTQAERKWILDISVPNEELLQNMRKNTRYAVRKSATQGLTVHSSTDSADFEKFWELFVKTFTDRKFIPHNKSYYIRQIDAFKDDKNYRIYWVEHENEILASALFPFYGNSAFYLHAATSTSNNKLFGAYAMMWKVIEDAKANNIKYLDFWGLAPNDDPTHPWAGFTFFKKGFGGFEENLMRGYDLPITKQYYAVKALDISRKYWSGTYFKLKQLLHK